MEPSSKVSAPSAGPEVQVRHATILRCDIVGSTHIKKRLDLDAQLAFRQAWEDVVTKAAQRHGGHVETFEGDGAMVIFGYPEVHEDMAEAAVTMGLDLTQAVGAIDVPGGPVAVRVGIATGPAATMRVAASAASEPFASLMIDVAERLRALAEPGQVVIADATRKLAGRFFDYVDLGPCPVKGFEEGVQAWRVAGHSSVTSRFEAQRLDPASARIVGRDAELEQLAQAWSDAREGRGRAVYLHADAGMGKSRLAYATLAKAARDGAAVLEIDCTPSTGNTPLFPLGVLLRRTAGIGPTTAESEKRALAERLVARLVPDDPHAIDYLAPLFGLASSPLPMHNLPAEARDRTIAIVLTMLRKLAEDRPVALLCEDLHWVDHTTGEVLARVAAQIAQMPALMIVTSRTSPASASISTEGMTPIELKPLGRDDAAALVQALTRGDMARANVDTIVDRCEGVPLVIEEVTRNALDASTPSEDAGQPWRGASAAPSTLDMVVESRLARAPDLVPLAQAAAVLGREVPRSVLQRLLPDDNADALDAKLARLSELGLLDAASSSSPSRLRFKHVMIMEAVYKTLIGRERLRLHSHAADTLRTGYHGSPDAAADVVAEHLRKARRFEEAVSLRLVASADTAARGAYVETQGHCEAGLALIDELPQGRERNALHVKLLVQLAVALTGQYGYAAAAVEAAYMQAQAIVGSDTDPALMYPIKRGLATFNLVRGRLAAAHALSLEAMALAERSGRPDYRIDAMSVHCYATLYYRDLAECRTWIERCLALYREAHGERLVYPVPQDAGTAALALLPTVAWLLGDAHGAEAAITEGLAHVERLDRDFDRALMNAWIAGARYTQRRYVAAAQHAAAAVEIAGRHRYGEWHAIGGLMALLAQAALQPAPAALAQAQAICDAFHKQEVGLNASYYLWALARGHARCGNHDVATALLGAATHFARTSEETRMDAELLLLAAEIEPDHERARSLLDTAIGIAHRQGALATALRGAAERALRTGDESVHPRARAALDALEGRADYPARGEWMREMLRELWPSQAQPA